jgi:hypothetical protein
METLSPERHPEGLIAPLYRKEWEPALEILKITGVIMAVL